MGLIRSNWVAGAGGGVALAFVDLSHWLRQRRVAAYVMFVLCSLSAAAIACFEWGMMSAETPERWAEWLRWVHLPLALLTISLVLFVRLQFSASRNGWTMPLIAVTAAALAANFLTGVNLDFDQVTGVRSIPVWPGIGVSVASGVRNPWIVLVVANATLMTAFLIDTMRAVHLHGEADEREKVVPVCLSILAFVLLASVWEILAAFGFIAGPLFVAPPFLGISLVMAYLIGRDIVHASSERNAAHELLRSMIESMPSTVLLLDRYGSIRFANTQAQAMLRYSYVQLIGMRIESMLPAGSRDAYAGLRASRQPTKAAVELSVLRSDASEIPVKIGLTPIQIDGEELTLASMTDISERKRSEQEAALQRDELAHLSRTASLSELSSSLAHELIQPLTAILSNAQAGARFLAHQPCDIEAGRASIDSVVDNAKRAGDVIRKLRNMLRKGGAEFVQLDLSDVVRDVMLIVRSDLIARRVDVTLDLAEDLPRISGDRVQLQQVVMNLMMNAADAMRRDDHARRLTLRTIPAGPHEIEVQVEDSGTGIPAENLERIFAPFVTSKAGGMGLGLSVCTMLIQAHGGRLWATNNRTEGATLHFRLPCFVDDTIPIRQRAGVRCDATERGGVAGDATPLA